MAFIQASVQPYENKATVTNRDHCNVRPDIWLTHTNNLALIELKAKYSPQNPDCSINRIDDLFYPLIHPYMHLVDLCLFDI